MTKKGRPAHKPTEESKKMVESMAAMGIPQVDIARIVGIHKETLEIHYRAELDSGAPKANARVAQSLFNQAISGNVTAQIFWLKTRARWKETHELELSGKDGATIAPIINVTLRSTKD